MIYLQASDAFGGHRYGPFPGDIRLGSDGDRCGMVLDAHQGIFPLHLTLHPRADGWFLATPGHPQGAVFVQAPGAEIRALRSPTPIAGGTCITLGTPQGPAFTLVAPAPRAASPRLDLGPIGDELARQVEARVTARAPFVREARALATRLRTGALISPVVLVSAGILLFGGLGVGVLACAGVLAWGFRSW